MAGKAKLGAMPSNIGFAIDAQGSRFLICIYSICDYDQVCTVQVRREIQSRRAEVEDLDIRTALVLATKHFDREWAKAVITHKHVS